MFRNFNYLLYKGESIVKNGKTYYKVPNYDYVYRGTFSYRLFLFADRSFRFENFFWKIIFTIGVVSDKLTKELF